MSTRVSVSLSDEEAALLREAVDGGAYASSGEVLREALREWRTRRVIGALWDDGLASGRSPAFTLHEVRRAARLRGA